MPGVSGVETGAEVEVEAGAEAEGALRGIEEADEAEVGVAEFCVE